MADNRGRVIRYTRYDFLFDAAMDQIERSNRLMAEGDFTRGISSLFLALHSLDLIHKGGTFRRERGIPFPLEADMT